MGYTCYKCHAPLDAVPASERQTGPAVLFLILSKFIIRPTFVALGPGLLGLGVAWNNHRELMIGGSLGFGIGLCLHWFIIPTVKHLFVDD